MLLLSRQEQDIRLAELSKNLVRIRLLTVKSMYVLALAYMFVPPNHIQSAVTRVFRVSHYFLQLSLVHWVICVNCDWTHWFVFQFIHSLI